ncbi:Transducin-like enhancer protein 3 [Lamprotornis superbus]|uniref:Transducin-like enhancer protein 3 n=1 Tax=Lamprotornis superbus TaxID=245042 RepID=A0A835NDP9_9PASS|nr:Transducin-like enhancer protein 3 [Lamprotornis superbus]
MYPQGRHPVSPGTRPPLRSPPSPFPVIPPPPPGNPRRRFPQAPHQPGQPGFKFTVAESCDRIKDEFQFLQAQYHSLKVEYDKLANEKTEMQRHYVMYYEMSYGLNIEMHKQVKSALIALNRE